jgi:hypothetical protein
MLKQIATLAFGALPAAAHGETLTMTNRSSYSECFDLAADLDGKWTVNERGPVRAVLSHGGLDYVLKRDGEAYLGSESRSRYGVRVTIDMRLEGDGMTFTTNWNCRWSSSKP